MLWTLEDFAPGALDLNTKFESVLPGADLLRDSVLDPGLAIQNWRGNSALKAMSIRSFTVDTLRLQQFILGDSSMTLGVLSEYAPYFQSVLGAFSIPMTTSLHALLEGIVLSIVGSVGATLSAIPNPYTQIAGALVGMGTQLYTALADGPQKLPPFSIPAQEYNERTDQDQFNSKVRPLLQLGSVFQEGVSRTDARLAFDYTPLFMPRMVGDPVLEYRYQGDRLGAAFGFGEHGGVMRLIERDCEIYREKGKAKARCDEDIEAGKSFSPSGPMDLGYVPGGVRITSVIQCFPDDTPSESAPWYDERCGGDKRIYSVDVGAFYTCTNQGIQLLWNMAMKNGPYMFAINPQRLASAWSDYIEAALDGVVWLWDNGAKDDWGEGTWHSMIATIASAFTTSAGGGQGTPGQIGAVFPDLSNCGPLTVARDPLFFEGWHEQNLYRALIKPALDVLADRQAQYLQESLIAAYLPRPIDNYVSGAIDSKHATAIMMDVRKLILQGPGKAAVNLEDVVDPQFRAQLEAAGPKFGPFDITAAPVVPGRPSGRLAMPPFPPTGQPPFAPPPFAPPPSRAGMTPLQKGLVAVGAVGVGAGAAYLARHQIADLYHRLRGTP